MNDISWENIFKLFLAMLASMGGASAIIFISSNWLGKVWASRILEKEKKEHAKDKFAKRFRTEN